VLKKLLIENLEFRHKIILITVRRYGRVFEVVDPRLAMQKQETYVKAITIRDPSDIHTIKEDVKKGMILILRVTPLAQKDVDKLRKVVEELYVIARDSNADIARLGDERIIVTPQGVKIWKPDYDLK
jgi:SepF-like predicted cell division protein (DUF552 family)